MHQVTNQPNPPVDPQIGIAYNAAQCEEALRLADFADSERLSGMAEGLRKLARFHADHAWAWVPRLQREGCAA